MKDGLAAIAVYRVNGKEEGEGSELAQAYGVKAFPTFIVVDSEGEVIRSWIGFAQAQSFLDDLALAVADPISIKGRQARYTASPNEKDAVALAEYHSSRMESLETLKLYQRARELSETPERGYELEIFTASVYALRSDQLSLDEVRGYADAVLAAPEVKPESAVMVAYYMDKVASSVGDAELAKPYIEAGVQAADRASSLSEEAAYVLLDVRIAYALRIDGDQERAVALKKQSLAKDWENDPSELNNYTWWCFENRCDLEQAELWAGKGVELAESDDERASILDTLAEIRFARGNRKGAMEAIGKAIELDPNSEYLKQQVVKFSGAAM